MNDLYLLLITAASLGFIHTLLGPDHYLPFIVLSRARNWTQQKTLWITFISGVGHVAGSVVLGIAGIALGISLSQLESIEARRGDVVALLLIAFGVLYSVYGLYLFLRNGGHHHLPAFMVPKKIREWQHAKINSNSEDTTRLTPWILFLIFVFGPCEVLIPLLIYPAAEHNTLGIAAVSIVFGLATVGTMLSIVFLGYKGYSLIRIKQREKYLHLVAGMMILLAGLAMQFLGW
ncbi:urease accessory protein UreH domain-containing protein [Roseimarinus sediminis]|uniref:urease accessory protein UreH domain-containing protein n=1 Tax=Roseimarinus sediminis TaxID=1610899 RepID=UPI003D1BAFA4